MDIRIYNTSLLEISCLLLGVCHFQWLSTTLILSLLSLEVELQITIEIISLNA